MAQSFHPTQLTKMSYINKKILELKAKAIARDIGDSLLRCLILERPTSKLSVCTIDYRLVNTMLKLMGPYLRHPEPE